MESEEVSKLPSEVVEVSEQASEEISGEVLGWKEHVVVLGISGRDLEKEELQSVLELGGGRSSKNAKGVRGQSQKNSKMASEQKRGCPLTLP